MTSYIKGGLPKQLHIQPISSFILHSSPPIPFSMAVSKWWPIGLLIATLICFAVGGGLVGGSMDTSSGYYDSPVAFYGMFFGGVAFLVIGALTKLAFWVFLIVYCVQRRRLRYARSNYVPSPPSQQKQQQQQQQQEDKEVPYPGVEVGRVEIDSISAGRPRSTYLPSPAGQLASKPPGTPTPTPSCDAISPVLRDATISPSTEKQTVSRFCGQCGASVSTPFCSQCGYQV